MIGGPTSILQWTKTVNVLFLDIDGVLNRPEGENAASCLGRSSLAGLDADILAIYAAMIARFEAVIVLSSTWRLVPSLCRRLISNGVKFDDVTPCADPTLEILRGSEIQLWLHDFPVVRRYAILDDTDDMLEHQMSNLFQTSPRTGLTQELADQIVGHFAHC
jgi:HAD domain in Swiss Army Knife RNA repair proteins